ncbi:PASTA domain-containing protein [Ilumatobacter sp.]|uniref:PASTA domain-containing protein n=1 Tax=Ilumatobacter sp. TaxID=1967498 RepID=UPI003B51CEB4
MRNDHATAGLWGSEELDDTVIAGRYRVVRVASSGASSVLLDAIDLEGSDPVSVKMVRPELARGEEFRRKFRRLAEVSHALTHPNILSVTDWGEIDVGDSSTVFWTVDALGGGSLRDLLDRGRLLEPGQALVVGLEACRALDAAHQKGLFHTEITPSKMVFGVDRRLRLVDFGMARLIAEPNWIDMATVPTHVARYASPEQALGLPIDAKTDVYALALVLIEAVTGSVPFAADSTVATLAARVDRLMPVSADLGGLASVLERAGRPEGPDRFTAAELGRALVKVAPRLPKPEPIPVIASGSFDSIAMRRPDDPTGGVERPAPPAAGPASAGARDPGAGLDPAPAADLAAPRPGAAPAAGPTPAETIDDGSTDLPTVPGDALLNAIPVAAGSVESTGHAATGDDDAPIETGDDDAPIETGDDDAPIETGDENPVEPPAGSPSEAGADSPDEEVSAVSPDPDVDPDRVESTTGGDDASGVPIATAAVLATLGDEGGAERSAQPATVDVSADDPGAGAPEDEADTPDAARTGTAGSGGDGTADLAADDPEPDGDSESDADPVDEADADPVDEADADPVDESDADPVDEADADAADVAGSTLVLPVSAAPDASTSPPPGPGAIDDAERSPRRRGPVVALVVLLVVGLAALGYAGSLLLATKSFTVPSLAGVPRDEALNQIAGNDWRVVTEPERSDSFPETGTVIRTDPGAGTELDEGSDFLLVLSAGPEFRTLPELTELGVDAAAARLSELGLTAREADERTFSETVDAGTVVSWQVEGDVGGDLVAGARILPGETVVLTVSAGPEPRVVPDLAGRTAEAAEAELADLGLELGRDDDVFSDEGAPGSIVEQRPASGEEVARDSVVTVTVSRGPDVAAFPELAGLSYTDAVDLLVERGLAVGSLLGTTGGTFVEASVDGEEVPPGRELRRGTVVDLVFL